MVRRSSGNGPGAVDRRLRQGLHGLRSAAPSSHVWASIEAELAPRPAAPRWRWRPSLPMATLVGAVFLVLLGLGGLNVGVYPAHRLTQNEVTPLPVSDHGLAPAELAIQPAVAPRPVDLALPPGAAPLSPPPALAGWHPPQLAFNLAPWPGHHVFMGSSAADRSAEALLQ